MNALAKAHQQMREDGAPQELLRGSPQVLPSNSKLPVVSEATAIIQIIERMARDVSLPLDRLEKVIELQERLAVRHAETAFNEAMARAQTEMRSVAVDSDNPQTRSRYASYAALDRAVRPIYTRQGFALSFNTGEGAPDQHVRVLCDVSNGGFTRRYHIDMPADGKGAKGGDVMTKTHAAGSAITYGMRYLLLMIFNIAVSRRADDDDGNAAGVSEFVTEDQAIALRERVEAIGASVRQFCNFLRVDGIAKIPANRLDEAKIALDNYETKNRGRR